LKPLFDKKTFDKTIKGYEAEEIKKWLSDVKEIDILKYYYYLPGSKFPNESKTLKNQPTQEVLSFLNGHFSETSDLFVEIQRKGFKSGRWEIIFRGRNPKGEIVRLCVLNFRRISSETTARKG